MPVSSTLHLIIADDAQLLEPVGGGLPVVALPGGVARSVEEAPEALQQKTVLVLKAGVNLRDAPNGEVLGKTSAESEVEYDAGRVMSAPAEATLSGDDGSTVVLQGAAAAGRVWLPVRWEDQEAWVADVVVEMVSER